jgi:anti-sigma factor RsiW
MDSDPDNGRRDFLKCMASAGTGALFTVAAGVPASIGLDAAIAAPPKLASFSFLQVSDSHIGFAKAANPDARATFREAIAKVKALPHRPDFIIHTGDVSQLSRDDLVDVQTSNDHVVRPWFNGKIDFAPPVPELAAQGFPLAGGRLDYLEGRTVPAIVYKCRLHSINLFVWPSKDERERRVQKDGYSIAEWSERGLRYAAVSDVSPGDLDQFRRAFVAASQ